MSGSNSIGGNNNSSSGVSYFVDHKRGEVNELKSLLSNPKLNKEPERKRDVIKKVIAYMTLGIDVSKLFSEMIMCTATKDLVVKKMIYHYLCNYAEIKPDLALLAINTLQKDSRDDDPMVRGLALRSLCSLRLPNLNEYVLIPLRSSLTDNSAYVRRTAVIGCSKLFNHTPEIVKNSDLIDILYNMLRDRDCSVISSAINSLNEILANEGGMVRYNNNNKAINNQIILYLLNRIKEFNEWGQTLILDLLCRYKPQNDNEMFDIMNLLEDRLKHSNSAVVLGTTKVFLLFTQHMHQVHQEVYKRLKAPMLTLMGSSSNELSYSILSHILLLVNNQPQIFQDEYKHFFIRFNDPSCVKHLRLQIITELANPKNLTDILTELSEYVTDVDSDIARYSIKCIATVAIKIPQAADEAIEHLLSFLDLNIDYVSTESIIVMKDILRKYPERYEEIIPPVQKCLKSIEESEGKIAVIWMIGEYGDTILDAPYILEDLIESFNDEANHSVRIELLTATMKLFFKRPPELQAMLYKLLNNAINDTGKVDVRERALLYYRLLKLDVHEAARIVNCPKLIVDSFVETQDLSVKNQIFQQFNSLSVVYQQPADRFIKKLDLEEKKRIELAEKAELQQKQNSNATTQILSEQEQEQARLSDDTLTNTSINSPQPSTNNKNNNNTNGTNKATVVDLLSQFDFGSDSSVLSSSSPNTTLSLTPAITLDKQTYASKWGSLPISTVFELQLRTGAIISSPIEAALSVVNILTFASGTVGNTIKLYLFAKSLSNAQLFLTECIVDVTSGNLKGTVKCESTDQQVINQYVTLFKSALAPLV